MDGITSHPRAAAKDPRNPAHLPDIDVDTVYAGKLKTEGIVRYHPDMAPSIKAVKDYLGSSVDSKVVADALFKCSDHSDVHRIDIVPVYAGSSRSERSRQDKVVVKLGVSQDAVLFADGSAHSATQATGHLLIDVIARARQRRISSDMRAAAQNNEISSSALTSENLKDVRRSNPQGMFLEVVRQFAEKLRIVHEPLPEEATGIEEAAAHVHGMPVVDELYGQPRFVLSESLQWKIGVERSLVAANKFRASPVEQRNTNKKIAQYRAISESSTRPLHLDDRESRKFGFYRSAARENFEVARLLQNKLLLDYKGEFARGNMLTAIQEKNQALGDACTLLAKSAAHGVQFADEQGVDNGSSPVRKKIRAASN